MVAAGRVGSGGAGGDGGGVGRAGEGAERPPPQPSLANVTVRRSSSLWTLVSAPVSVALRQPTVFKICCSYPPWESKQTNYTSVDPEREVCIKTMRIAK